jgi:hypothetical protein
MGRQRRVAQLPGAAPDGAEQRSPRIVADAGAVEVRVQVGMPSGFGVFRTLAALHNH